MPKIDVVPEQAARRVAMMRDAFGAGALVEDFDELINEMRCDSKIRHVIASVGYGLNVAGTVVSCG